MMMCKFSKFVSNPWKQFSFCYKLEPKLGHVLEILFQTLLTLHQGSYMHHVPALVGGKYKSEHISDR